MDELADLTIPELEPAYRAPDDVVNGDMSFNIDYYKSHLVPVREIVELKKATPHE